MNIEEAKLWGGLGERYTETNSNKILYESNNCCLLSQIKGLAVVKNL